MVWGKWIRALGERGFLFDEGGEQVADGWIDAASAGCWMLDAGCWMLDIGCPGLKGLVAGCDELLGPRPG